MGSNIWGIANDVDKRMAKGASAVRKDSKFIADRILQGRARASEYWFLFDYQYDPDLKKWNLMKITGHDYGIELYRIK
jgi:hypothetical protein